MKKYSLIFLVPIFLASHSSAQTFNWVAQIGGIDYESGYDIATDSLNNVYLVGIFYGTIDCDPGAGVHNITSPGGADAFVVKLDSAKNFKWVAQIGGTQNDFTYELEVKGNAVYAAGRFRSTVDFDPGPGVYNLTSVGGEDFFVLKLDLNGNFVWAKQIGGTTGDESVESLTIDHHGDVLVGGLFTGTVDFDPNGGTQFLTSTGYQDAYVLKLDANGNYLWAHHYGSSQGVITYGISVDDQNDLYTTGLFYGTVDFDPGAGVFNLVASTSYCDVYIFKWTSAGNFSWAKKIGATNTSDVGYAIRNDQFGNPIIAGTFQVTVDFDPGSGVYNLTSAGNDDIFVLKLASSDGSFIFARNMGGATLDAPYALEVNSADDIFVGGLFSTTADFDPGAATFNLTASGPDDAYIVQLNESGNFVWAFNLGGSQDDYSQGLLTSAGKIYLTGTFAYTADFDPGAGVYNVSSFSTSNDVFLLKLNFCTPAQTTLNVSLCPGDSIFAGGAWQTTPGTYTDLYSTVEGCDSTVTTIINYTFTVDLGSDISICSGEQATLDAGNAGANYLWSTGATTQMISVSAQGNYTVTVTIAACSVSDKIHVTVHPLPIVNLGSDTAICENSPLVLDAGVAQSYLWSTGSTTQTISVTAAGNYSVIVTNSFGCIDSDEIAIAVNPLPQVSLGNDTTVCEGGHLLLDAGEGFVSYMWNDGSSNQSLLVNESAGVYVFSVTVTDANGCSNSDSVTITFEDCMGMETAPAASSTVFFNPETNVLSISSPEIIEQVCVYDLQGRLQMNAKANNYALNIPLPLLSGGLYFISVRDGAGWGNFKIITVK